MPNLFDPITLRSITFKNRIGVSPMCQYSCTDGVANNWHFVHLGSRAVGGAGLVMVEASAVTPEGRITAGDMGLWNDAQAEAFKPIAAFIQKQGSVAGIQLAHAGRKASCDLPQNGGAYLAPDQPGGWWPIVAPSAIAFNPQDRPPHAISIDEIRQTVDQFAQAAQRALNAGFQFVEIHAAHGYLLHEFLSPISNQREDEYGGSLDNRIRIVKEVVEAVRSNWPSELPLLLRISASDWVPSGGWDIDQSIELAKAVKPLGVDLVDCSSGGTVPDAKIPSRPGYQVPFAEAVKHQAALPTAAVGLITHPQQAQSIIQDEQADMVFLARELLRDPYWPLHAAQVLGVDVDWPVQYDRAKSHPPAI